MTNSRGTRKYHIDYHYSAAGRDYTNSETTSARTYAAVNYPGDVETREATVPVRHFELGPLHDHVLGKKRWGDVGALLFAALFWNGILSIFVNLAWIAPIRGRSLVRGG